MPGCLFMLIIISAWVIISAIISELFGASENVAFIVGLPVTIGLFVLFVFLLGNSAEKEQVEKKKNDDILEGKIYNIIYNKENFTSEELYIASNHLAFIAVDEKALKILIGGVDVKTDKIDYKVIKGKDVLGIEVTENGKGILSSSVNRNTLGMAAIGGMLFGGAGAIVGALSGRNTKSIITDISLRMALDDIKTPYIGINFASDKLENGSNDHLQVKNAAEKWYGIINIISERARNIS